MQFLSDESLEAGDKYSCPECQTLTNAKLTTKFETMPQYLIVHVKRFEESIEDGGFKKIRKSIKYPLQLKFDE